MDIPHGIGMKKLALEDRKYDREDVPEDMPNNSTRYARICQRMSEDSIRCQEKPEEGKDLKKQYSEYKNNSCSDKGVMKSTASRRETGRWTGAMQGSSGSLTTAVGLPRWSRHQPF